MHVGHGFLFSNVTCIISAWYEALPNAGADRVSELRRNLGNAHSDGFLIQTDKSTKAPTVSFQSCMSCE